MELPAHFRLTSRLDYALGLLLRAVPAFLFIGGAVLALVLFARREGGLPPQATLPLCGLVCFGVLAIAILLPVAWKRIQGFLEVRTVLRTLAEARISIDAGRPAVAAEKLSAVATRIAGKLQVFHVIVVGVAGVAYSLAGQVELGRALLEEVERSGWLDALSMRAHRTSLRCSIVTLRAIDGDVAGAERVAARLRGVRVANDAVETARVLLAARRGDPDARTNLRGLLQSGLVTSIRGRGSLLVVDGVLASAAGETDADARIAAEVRALRPRLFAHYRAGWPEVRAWLERHAIDDATA